MTQSPSSADRHPRGADFSPSGSLAGIRVLLAEDNPTNQMIALSMLGRLGCISELVADGVKVLERLDQVSFDIVLMDVQMPRMDGRQATIEIRRREATGWIRGGFVEVAPRIPVVAMTANVTEQDRVRCLDAQMDDYLTKPFTIDQLAEVLHRWVERPASASTPSSPTPPTTPLGAALPQDLRRERLEEISQGDASFERELLSCLVNDVGGSLERLTGTPSPLNLEQAANLLHGIVGACRTVGADALAQAARAAEDQAKRPGMIPPPDWLSAVEAAYGRLLAVIKQRAAASNG